MSYANAAAYLRQRAPTQSHDHRREFFAAADVLDGMVDGMIAFYQAGWQEHKRGHTIHLIFPEHQVDAFYKIVNIKPDGELVLKEVEA